MNVIYFTTRRDTTAYLQEVRLYMIEATGYEQWTTDIDKATNFEEEKAEQIIADHRQLGLKLEWSEL